MQLVFYSVRLFLRIAAMRPRLPCSIVFCSAATIFSFRPRKSGPVRFVPEMVWCVMKTQSQFLQPHETPPRSASRPSAAEAAAPLPRQRACVLFSLQKGNFLTHSFSPRQQLSPRSVRHPRHGQQAPDLLLRLCSSASNCARCRRGRCLHGS